jgi:hypothetical protein
MEESALNAKNPGWWAGALIKINAAPALGDGFSRGIKADIAEYCTHRHRIHPCYPLVKGNGSG